MASPPKIKICGIKTSEDALMCLKAGADYLGFNFYTKSKRYVRTQQVKGILSYLRMHGYEKVYGVGVFVNAPPELIREIASGCGLRIVQLHGQEPPSDIESLKGFLRIKSLPVAGPRWAERIGEYGADAYLADAPGLASFGGAGEAYDYSLAAEAAKAQKLFLAGGLTPYNVAEAIRAVRPFAVDVASGVENTAGTKDPGKVKAFVDAVRHAYDLN